jgi:hypothetical protein
MTAPVKAVRLAVAAAPARAAPAPAGRARSPGPGRQAAGVTVGSAAVSRPCRQAPNWVTMCPAAGAGDAKDRRRVVIHLQVGRAMRDVAPVFVPVVQAWHDLAAGYTDSELEFIVTFQQRAENVMREQVGKLRGGSR